MPPEEPGAETRLLSSNAHRGWRVSLPLHPARCTAQRSSSWSALGRAGRHSSARPEVSDQDMTAARTGLPLALKMHDAAGTYGRPEWLVHAPAARGRCARQTFLVLMKEPMSRRSRQTPRCSRNPPPPANERPRRADIPRIAIAGAGTVACRGYSPGAGLNNQSGPGSARSVWRGRDAQRAGGSARS